MQLVLGHILPLLPSQRGLSGLELHRLDRLFVPLLDLGVTHDLPVHLTLSLEHGGIELLPLLLYVRQ